MISEEREQKLLDLYEKRMVGFLDSLSSAEVKLIVQIPPELFGRIWHAAMIAALEIAEDFVKESKHD